MIMLGVNVTHTDGRFFLEKEAPMLPAGVTWHKGMVYREEVDGDQIELTVDYVSFVFGIVYVYFNEEYRSPISDESKRDFTGMGWREPKPTYMVDEREYLNSLKPGERVVDTSQSCKTGQQGTVYVSTLTDKPVVCVRWDEIPGDGVRIGTIVTPGTRRVSDVSH